jgi:hypothetical protein
LCPPSACPVAKLRWHTEHLCLPLPDVVEEAVVSSADDALT